MRRKRKKLPHAFGIRAAMGVTSREHDIRRDRAGAKAIFGLIRHLRGLTEKDESGKQTGKQETRTGAVRRPSMLSTVDCRLLDTVI